MNPVFRLVAFWASALLFFGFTLVAGTTSSLASDASKVIYCYLGMGITGLSVWAFFPNTKGTQQLVLIFALAIVCRLMMVGFPTSDDVNRYLWEGKLLLAGESPYALTAEDPAWIEYRDSFWEGMNHKDKKTAYPPASLTLFALLNLISYNPWIYKLAFGLADVATLGVIVALLHHRKLPIRTALIYALNPITIFAFSGEAHFDSLFVFLTLCALLFWERGKLSWAWALLGLSIQIKLMSVLIIPLLFWQNKSAKCIWILAPLVLPSLLFWDDMGNLISGILHFGGTMSHNGSLNHLFIDFLGSRESASKLSMLLLVILVGITSLKSRDVLKGSFIIFGALILLSPTVHYWYLSWVLPFVVLFPSLPWLLTFVLSGFYFIAWVKFGKTGEWYQPIAYLRLQWIPFYLLWTLSFFRGFRKLWSHKTDGSVTSISVVIPTLNEAVHLSNCLESIEASEAPFKEIIVVDGGSSDETAEVVHAYGAKLLSSKRGRGYQIAAGVEECSGDAILVLHADAQIPKNSSTRILEVLCNNPEAAGGAIGQRFIAKSQKPVLVLIEALNDFRAQWQGNSFGDQGQFFRRSAIKSIGGYPSIPLMEDVELTAQLAKQGDLLLLDCDLQCSARRWERERSMARIVQVLSLVIRYKVQRLLGKDPSEKMFKEYYSSQS